jgi:chemotaxis regulatin CheY-phosphate phosphatase CheZ
MTDLAKNMSNVFEKINDLKNLFKFGEKIVPIIQSLIEFMREIVPLLENINFSIADTTNKMPQAQNQISNVTSATELATTEILDLADKITLNLSEIDKLYSSIEQKFNKKKELKLKLRDLLKNNNEAAAILDEFDQVDDYNSELEKMSAFLSSVKNDVYEITLSLQVQDITAQQLASVNHLIESVQHKLTSIITDIEDSEINDELSKLQIDVPAGVHFDPNATYLNKGKQDQIDVIIKEQSKNTSQAEIDKLFA